MRRWLIWAAVGVAMLGALVLMVGCAGVDEQDTTSTQALLKNMVVVGFNELGMHCMNRDFSKLMILPPYNTLKAQVIRRGEEPEIMRSGVTVDYTIPNHSNSAGRTNFWTHAEKLLGLTLAPNVGLTGHGLAGRLTATGDGRYEATGIPLTPMSDTGKLNPYPLATLTVKSGGAITAKTKAVLPVSWEISCNLCHKAPDGADKDILRSHDRLHGTNLAQSTPVACGRCHQQPPLVGVLGQGNPALPTLSRAMHGAHTGRMALVNLPVSCYACHPGVKTQCQRDVHKAAGMECTACHGSMKAVASSTRKPWVSEPRCGSCHVRAGFQFEQTGKLFRESRGHNGVYCTTCHNTPHAIVPTMTKADNVQNTGLQGYAGTLNKCSVCHINTPGETFNHTLSD